MDLIWVIVCLLLIAGLQGYNWSRIERIEAEYEVIKKMLSGRKDVGN